jgi:hypothetical protein
VNIGILAWIGKGWRRIALYDTRSSWTASADHTRWYGQCYYCIYEPLVHIKVTGVEWGFQVSFQIARNLCEMILYPLAQDKEAASKICVQTSRHLHIEPRPLLLHPALPLPLLAALELDPAIYPTQFERHSRPVILVSYRS